MIWLLTILVTCNYANVNGNGIHYSNIHEKAMLIYHAMLLITISGTQNLFILVYSDGQ